MYRMALVGVISGNGLVLDELDLSPLLFLLVVVDPRTGLNTTNTR